LDRSSGGTRPRAGDDDDGERERAGCVVPNASMELMGRALAADEGHVTTIVALLSSVLRARAALVRALLAATIAMAAAAGTLALAAAPAAAVVTEVGGAQVGLQPRDLASADDGTTVGEFRDAGAGPILPDNHVYVVYWEPTNAYNGNWQAIIDKFFEAMGGASGSLGNVFAVDSQYVDPANQHAFYKSTSMGSYTDYNAYPKSGKCTDPSPLHGGLAITCLTDKQIREQLETFISQHHLPKGMENIYYLLTPPGVTVCLAADHCSDYPATPAEIEEDEAKAVEPEAYKIYEKSFCSYHSDINPDKATDGDGNTILYAVVPWIAGGEGDFHLAPEDRTAAYDCQDGGFYFNAATSETEKEHPKITTAEEEAQRLAAEKKENEELTAYEQSYEKGLITKAELETKETELGDRRTARIALEEAERQKRMEKEGPHEQEPNQDGRGQDGSYDAGLADLIVSQIGVEQQNIVTDPLLNGWQDGGGNESTDECRNFFAPASGGLNALAFTGAGTLSTQTFGTANAYINDAFDLAAYEAPYPGVPCLTGVEIEPSFTPPNPVKSGEIVGFDGMESTMTLDAGVKFVNGKEELTYPTYTWNFGDGAPEVSGYAPGAPSANSPADSPCEEPWLTPCAGSSYHSYQYGGTYTVTLTVKDTGGHTASVSHTVTVEGPPPPSPGPEASGSSTAGAGSGAGSSSPSASGAAAHACPPAPVAAAVILRQGLRRAAHRGLAVGYSVNEQVAGRFEVLLSQSVARRLGIGGSRASGLPAGSPAELVIGKTILVTTKGGHSAVRIQFSKRTAARLMRARQLALTLRMTVRNAASGTPTSTTVTTSATLSR
jgi:hypothetical protein